MENQGNTSLAEFKDRYEIVSGLLRKNERAIKLIAAKHIDAERLARLALTEFRRTPDLALCEPSTVVGSVLQAAHVGLEIGGVLGRAFLIPFKNKHRGGRFECQFVLGYKGMIELAYRSDRVESIEGDVVYEGDLWEYRRGLNRVLEHVPRGEDDPNKIVAAYGIVRMRKGGLLCDAISRQVIERAKASSPARNNGPWIDFFPQMALKTVVRKQFKFCPISTELSRAIAYEEMAEAGIPADEIVDYELSDAKVETEQLKEAPPPKPKRALDKLVEKSRAETPPLQKTADIIT